MFFTGFSAAELQVSESLAPYHDPADKKLLNSATSTNFTWPIHPVFARPRWQEKLPKHQALFPLGNGRPGFWQVDHLAVWRILEPALRLATQFLNVSTAWSWWDTLLAGEYSQIPVKEYPKDYDYTERGMRYRLTPRSPQTIHQDRIDVNRILMDLSKKVSFHLCSGDINMDTGDRKQHNTTGLTEFCHHGNTIVWFSFENLEPLLNDQITAAERMMCNFKNATILLHELTHAFWWEIWEKKSVRPGSPGKPLAKEPYIGADFFAELGFSMEMHVFGGITAGFEFNQPATANSKGTTINTWNAKDFIVLAEYPILTHRKADDWKHQIYFPVPLRHYFNVNDPNFWTTRVQSLGGKAAHLGPKKVGSGWDGKESKLDPATGSENVDMAIYSFETKDIFIVNKENARRAQRGGIIEAIGALDRGERPAGMKGPNLPTPADKSANVIGLRDMATRSTDERNNEIAAYFDDSRLIMAVDTMGKMSESVLYSHLIRTVGLGREFVTPAEFRQFLKACQKAKVKFSWAEVNRGPRPTQGVVRFVKYGWSPDDGVYPDGPYLPMPRVYQPPSKERLDQFDACVKHMMVWFSHYTEEGHRDQDFNVFCDWINYSFLSEYPGQAAFFTRQDVLCCIYDWEARGERWTIGPLDLPEGHPPFRYPSVVRKLADGWEPKVIAQKGVAQKVTKKRKIPEDEDEDEEMMIEGGERPVVCGKEPLSRKRRMMRGSDGLWQVQSGV
ncbi:uncharacterized protein RCO7_07661 [Rhynchosporium graminicola]|uniref:Uncharacterized protein n=1 Tax=Rhynchosporium graminicola TaxID=2792576 RepID=A0A1E1KZB8_9HELO|nr:uncharacterized protein RCO7_07661 [Rhynchosporium commune]